MKRKSILPPSLIKSISTRKNREEPLHLQKGISMSDTIEIVEQNVRQYIPHFYVDYLGLPDREIVVLLALKSFAWNHKDNCYPSIEKIAKRINKKSRQVGEIIQCLAKRGLVIIENRPGHSSRYILTNNELKDCKPLAEEVQRDPTPAEIRVPTPAEIRVQNSISINNKKNNQSWSSDDDHQAFVLFWNQYPKKVAKEDAIKAWKKNKLYEHANIIIADVINRTADDWKHRDKKHIPNAATYLNGKRWNDEIIKQGQTNNANKRETSAEKCWRLTQESLRNDLERERARAENDPIKLDNDTISAFSRNMA